jgi:two-component system, LuxR family, sensor kinase FixL
LLVEIDDLGNPIMATEAVNGITNAQKPAAPIVWSANSGCRAAALSVGYVLLYLTLDRLSVIGALHGTGITPWSPSTGLAIALLTIKGLRYAPLVLAAEISSNATLPIVPLFAVPVFLGALVVSAGYTGAAAILRSAGLQAGIHRSSGMVLLLIVTIISSGFVASGVVATYAAAGVIPWSGFAEAGFHFWIGDAIGTAALLPPLLLLNERICKRIPLAHGRTSLKLIEFAAQGASIVLALAAMFSGMGGDYPLGLFYLLFLPLIWVATRHGLPAAAWAVLTIQVGLIAGLEVQGHSEATVRAFQLFMFALAATGLMLGAVVTERRRLALALVDSEGRRAAILNTARDGVLTVDARGSIQSINLSIERMFSRPCHGLIGHNICGLFEGVPDLLQRCRPGCGWN